MKRIFYAIHTDEYTDDDFGAYDWRKAYIMAIEEKRANPQMRVEIVPLWEDSGEVVEWKGIDEITEDVLEEDEEY